MKSEESGAYVMTNPAMVEAKDKIVGASAGSAGGGLMRCLPPMPSATTYTTRTGIHARRSYLEIVSDGKEGQDWFHEAYQLSTL